jgi:guanylate kinase
MLEYTEYCGNFYGTPKKEAEEVLESGKNLILEIEVEGAENVKKKYPDAVLVLLLPPSYSVQEQRLRGRGTETEEKIRERLARAREEILHANSYDYVVYNRDGMDREAANDILAIVNAEQHSLLRNSSVAEDYLNS